MKVQWQVTGFRTLQKPFLHRFRFTGGGVFVQDDASHATIHVSPPFYKPYTGMLLSGLGLAIGLSLSEGLIPSGHCSLS